TLTIMLRCNGYFQVPPSKPQSPSFASIRGWKHLRNRIRNRPQQPATSSTNLHLLARLAPTCTKNNLCGFDFLRALRVSVVNLRNPTHNPNLNPSNQTTPIVS